MPEQVPQQPGASPKAAPAARKRSREASEEADGPSSPCPIKRERVDDEEEADSLARRLGIPAETLSDVGHDPPTPFIKLEVDDGDYVSDYPDFGPHEADEATDDWRGHDKDAWRGNTEDEEPWEVRLHLALRDWHPERHVDPRGARVMDSGVDSGYSSNSSEAAGRRGQGM